MILFCTVKVNLLHMVSLFIYFIMSYPITQGGPSYPVLGEMVLAEITI